MATLYRRLFLGVLLTAFVLIATDAPFPSPGRVPAASATTPLEVFITPVPTKLYAGVASHTGAAQGNSSLGLRGYCIDIQTEGHVGVGGGIDTLPIEEPPKETGFEVVNGEIVSVDKFDNGSATTLDDVYCVVVRQPVVLGSTSPSTGARPPLTIRWRYKDTGSATEHEPLTLTLPVVYVNLKGITGVVGGSAAVCTEGWDPTFLTGRASNTPPGTPNALDVVAPADWTVLSPPGVSIVGVFKQGNEQCVTLQSNAPQSNISVRLDFWAVFDRTNAADDVALFQTGTTNIVPASVPELRHITTGGSIFPSPEPAPNVIGALHAACIIPSVPGDVLLPQNISFVSTDGATTSNLTVFSDGVNNPIGLPSDFTGVPNGTLCFAWTSTNAGRQTITASFTASPANPTNGTPNPRVFAVSWDSDGDGNGSGQNNALLTKTWNRITRTEITTGGDYKQGIVTNGSTILQVDQNIASGAYLGDLSLYEWVIGNRPGFEGPIDGVPVTISILPRPGATFDATTPRCGYFDLGGSVSLIPPAPVLDPQGAVIQFSAVTVDGRVQFNVSVNNDPDCNQSSHIYIDIRAAYPSGIPGDNKPFPHETLDIGLTFTSKSSDAPQVLWAGSTATITYSFAGDCRTGPNPNQPLNGRAIFVRGTNQRGSFIPEGNVIISGADTAIVPVSTTNNGCTFSVKYEAESQGEVDIAAFLQVLVYPSPTAPANTGTYASIEYSKVVYNLFFLEFESLTLTTEARLNVSELGNLDAQVRGWFVGTNPSQREATITADGRALPARRWVLPDDWMTLRGPEGFRSNWPSAPSMPSAQVTWYMENEGVKNKFPAGPKEGALGFFWPDDGFEFSYNVQPQTKQPSILGSLLRPRIISEMTDLDGYATVDTYGDYNLSFEGCPVNPLGQGADCRPGDVVGRTRYFARVEYPGLRGKHPPINSNTVETIFEWAGYKRVTIVDDPLNPQYKYVVAHLKDRDGYCDADGLNNVLGIQVQFVIDAGDGIIDQVQAPPSTISIDKRIAVATTYDTEDDAGNAIHTDIAKPVIEPDECQAWVRISNSLRTVVNVTVMFPPPPVPIPAEVRLTGLTCGAGGTATVKNLSSRTISLAGFGVRSANGDYPQYEEHLDLDGILAPGETKLITGAPGYWLYASDPYLFGNVTNDYARLVWNGYEISRITCAGVATQNAIPDSFQLEGEGSIYRDVIVNFTDLESRLLVPGWNLLTTGAGTADIAVSFGANVGDVVSVQTWDAATSTWKKWLGPGNSGNTIEKFEPNTVYWVRVNRAFTVLVPK